MSFALDNGYTPSTVSDLMGLVRAGVNQVFGTSYDEDTFLGTNFYKFFYALIQRLQENEVKTSEIVLKLQQYFAVTNEKITRPNTTNPGIVDYFASKGYAASVKAPIDADAGKIYIAVDVSSSDPDYATKKAEICGLVKDCVVAGVISQGSEVTTITLSNDQSFDFKFNKSNRIPIKLKVTLTLSANNRYTILSDEEIREKLVSNISSRYRMGLAFEPQRYFSVLDAPWAGSVLLQYSTDGGTTWASSIYASAYNDLFTFTAADVTVVEA